VQRGLHRSGSRRIVAGIVGHRVDGVFRVGPADVGALPPAKQQLYNYQRRSKVFVKTL
jgi:hypothetical protein